MDALTERVRRLLAEEVAPTLALDGAALEVVDVTDGVVRLRLHGACGGCPATVWSLLQGLEHELRQRCPEIDYLEAVP